MTTTIISNGGGNAQPIEALFERLESDTLDSTFEDFGNFVDLMAYEDGSTSFFGNFSTYSHVFNVRTDDSDLIDRLTVAIRRNQATASYKELRDERVINDEAKRVRRIKAEEKRMADRRNLLESLMEQIS